MVVKQPSVGILTEAGRDIKRPAIDVNPARHQHKAGACVLWGAIVLKPSTAVASRLSLSDNFTEPRDTVLSGRRRQDRSSSRFSVTSSVRIGVCFLPPFECYRINNGGFFSLTRWPVRIDNMQFPAVVSHVEKDGLN